MASEWRNTTLGEIIELKRGYDLTTKDRRPGPYPVISSSGISGYHAEAKVKAPGVVTGRYGTIGQVFYITEDFWPHNTALYVRDFKGNDPRFISYFLQTLNFLAYSDKAAVPGVNRNHLHMATVRVPNLSEQRAIAHILGALDDKIELNRQMNQTLEAIARALFKSWFVDFDPVRAKAAGEQPPGLAPHIADLFPDELVESELGEIPKGWEVKYLGDLMSLDKGVSYKGAFLTTEGTPMINLGCFLGRGRFLEKSIKYYSGEYRQRHVVHAGDLVLANTDITQKREVLGSPALIPPSQDAEEMIFTHHVFAARFHQEETAWKLFMYMLLLQDKFRDRATGFATGTTVLALPRDAVLGLEFIAPPLKLVLKFESVARQLIEKQWSNTVESRTLAVLRDTLLPKLISGELRVPDAERIVGRCV